MTKSDATFGGPLPNHRKIETYQHALPRKAKKNNLPSQAAQDVLAGDDIILKAAFLESGADSLLKLVVLPKPSLG